MIEKSIQVDDAELKHHSGIKNSSISKNENSVTIGSTSRSHISKIDDNN